MNAIVHAVNPPGYRNWATLVLPMIENTLAAAPRIRANRKEQKILLSLLRVVRVEAGLRQTDMALALNVPQSYVSKYESGERRLDPLELRAVCKAAGVSLAEFGRRLDDLLN